MPVEIQSATHGVLWPLHCPLFAQTVNAACVCLVCAVAVVCACVIAVCDCMAGACRGQGKARESYLIPIVRVCVYVCFHVCLVD